jgi:hypothetical protein
MITKILSFINQNLEKQLEKYEMINENIKRHEINPKYLHGKDLKIKKKELNFLILRYS